MPMPLTRQALDQSVCATPDCTHRTHRLLFLHGHCHPDAPVQACYDKASGLLRVLCARCQATIVDIVVGEA